MCIIYLTQSCCCDGLELGCEWLTCWSCSYWLVFFFKQKTAYEMRISDWSSDVCSSDLAIRQSAGTKIQFADQRQTRIQRSARSGRRNRRQNIERLSDRKSVV